MWKFLVEIIFSLSLFLYAWAKPWAIEPTYLEASFSVAPEKKMFLQHELAAFQNTGLESDAITLSRLWLENKSPLAIQSSIKLLELFVDAKSSDELRLVLGALYAEIKRCDLTVQLLTPIVSPCPNRYCPEDKLPEITSLRRICGDVLADKRSYSDKRAEKKHFQKYLRWLPLIKFEEDRKN